MAKTLTYAQVAAVLKYEPKTGKLFWIPRPESFPRASQFNGQFAGQEALIAMGSNGYRQGMILGVRFKAHRVVWLLVHGSWPPADIDHINGDRQDNRPENLRCVTRQENLRNARRKSNNTSGVNGVCQYGKHRRWKATITVDAVSIHLGCFDTKEEAAACRAEADRKHGFTERHGTAT